jgi:parallel beta-helix repeat protein
MSTIRTGRTWIRVSAAALLLVPVGAASAEAQELACGTTVVDNITLQQDLVGCPPGTNGLTIGADGISVDLNGHKIIGRSGSANGVDNSDGHNGVKIIGDGGSVSGFTNGIEIRGSSGTQVSGLTVQDNAEIGLRVLDSRDGRFSDLTVVGNRGGGAVFAGGADHNEIRATSFTRNGAAGLVIAGDANVVVRNWANNNAGGGFVVKAGGTSIQLTENHAKGNAASGFTIESAGTTLKANVGERNTKLGIDAVEGTSDAGGNRASGNGDDAQCRGVACTGR